MRSYFAMCFAPLLGISSGAYAAEIKVLCDGPLRPALTQIAQAFERDSGHQMKVEFGLSPVIHKKVIDGEPADVIIIQPNFIEELVTAGKLAAGEHPIIARVGIGLMVRAGTDAPDVSTADLLKQALLAADSIVFSNVAAGNAFAKALEQLGIAEIVKDKVTRTTPADVIARILQSKGRDIGVGPYLAPPMRALSLTLNQPSVSPYIPPPVNNSTLSRCQPSDQRAPGSIAAAARCPSVRIEGTQPGARLVLARECSIPSPNSPRTLS
jgi:hypothetical protein